MDEWEPATSDRPALILVHGGGWYYGCRRSLYHEAYVYSQVYGFDVFSIDWRLACLGNEVYHQEVTDLCGWPWQRPETSTTNNAVAAQDVLSAIAYLKAHSTDFPNWDGTNIAALGTSAGGTVLLEAVASTTDPDELPQVVATWSATMSFATFVDPPHEMGKDEYDSYDTCDHAQSGDYSNINNPGKADDCWTGVDHYLDSVEESGDGICGFATDPREVDRDTTDVDPDGPSSTCGADSSEWADASPRVEWGLTGSGAVPVFIANGGGPYDYDVEAAETVPLRELANSLM
jgi:acetyl esterase/lipase